MKYLQGKFCRLREIDSADLPLLLEWRNQAHVIQNMEYQETILWEDHLKWFERMKQENYHYFLIETSDGIPIGAIYVSGKNDENGAESGLYIGNIEFIGTGITLEASNILIKYAFDELQIDYLFAKVKEGNERIIRYNEALGFKIKGELHPGFLKMVLKKEDQGEN